MGLSRPLVAEVGVGMEEGRPPAEAGGRLEGTPSVKGALTVLLKGSSRWLLLLPSILTAFPFLSLALYATTLT